MVCTNSYFGVLILGVGLPLIYSFLLFKKMSDKMKYIFLADLIFLVALLCLVSGEDDWIGVDGQWQKHGNPLFPMPSKTCYDKNW